MLVEHVTFSWSFIYYAGAEDPRCPVPGLQEAVSIAANAYEEVGAAEKFMVTMQTNVF
jgi:hypothetical protein